MILAPFVVPMSVESLTVIPLRFVSSGRFPKLPMLVIIKNKIKLSFVRTQFENRGSRGTTDVPEAMSRAAGDSGHENVFGAMADRNTIISGSYDGAGNLNIRRTADVDSVGVGAFVGRGDGEFANVDIFAVCNLQMDTHAVDEIQVVNLHVFH